MSGAPPQSAPHVGAAHAVGCDRATAIARFVEQLD